MAAESASLSRCVAVGTTAVFIASLFCFYLLEMRNKILLRTLGPWRAYLLAGLIYPVVVGVALASVVSRSRQGTFVVVFGGSFIAGIGLMTLVLKLVPSVVGGYAAGFSAVLCLGSGVTYYLSRRPSSVAIGLLLACWTFLGDIAGYRLRHAVGGLLGAMVYAGVWGVVLGSGLGTVLWFAQRWH